MSEASGGAVEDGDIPLRQLDDAAFLTLRTLLAEHGFTESGVCAHAGVESLFDFLPRRHARAGDTPVEGALDVLVRLFMDSYSVPRSVVQAHLGDSACELLLAFGLVQRRTARNVASPGTSPGPAAEAGAELLEATVLLYPTAGPWLVSDRAAKLGGTARSAEDPDFPMREDVVYPALTSSGRFFLSTLPVGPVADYLELCSGTGVAALMGAAAGSERSLAVDITARSTVFAEFNARLNGLERFAAVQGNLWEPVAGRTFDIIAAHPPYVPATEPGYVYRDGGEDGEQITRAILSGVATHLAPRGVFHCTCIISSRPGAPAPHRVRAMLGDASSEFDLVFLRNGTTRVSDMLSDGLLSPSERKQREALTQLRVFTELRVESVDFCTIVLRRHAADRRGFSMAVPRSASTTWEHVAWSLAIGEASLDTGAFAERLLDSRVRLAPSARLHVEYRAGAAGEDPWQAEGGRVSVAVPYVADVNVGMGDATMLARFDGTRTLREQLAVVQHEGLLPANVDPVEFAQSFSQLVLDGIVETEAFPLP